MRRILCSVLISAVLIPACESDPTRPQQQTPTPTIKSLTTRENVLNNLEVCYNQRKLSPYNELMDANFAFFFSPGDVGGNIPEKWDRVEELSMAHRLFDKDPSYPVCRSIRVDLKFEDGVTWADTIPPAFPAETWYMTTVYYACTFEIDPDLTFITVPGARAQVMVRNIGTDEAPQWRLVEWRDLGYTALLSAKSTESSTWGGIKALYL